MVQGTTTSLLRFNTTQYGAGHALDADSRTEDGRTVFASLSLIALAPKSFSRIPDNRHDMDA